MNTWSVWTENEIGAEIRIVGGLTEEQARGITRFIRSNYSDYTVFFRQE